MAANAKKKRSTRQKNKKKTENGFVIDEILVWVTLAISILILLSNFGLRNHRRCCIRISYEFVWNGGVYGSICFIWSCDISDF